MRDENKNCFLPFAYSVAAQSCERCLSERRNIFVERRCAERRLERTSQSDYHFRPLSDVLIWRLLSSMTFMLRRRESKVDRDGNMRIQSECRVRQICCPLDTREGVARDRREYSRTFPSPASCLPLLSEAVQGRSTPSRLGGTRVERLSCFQARFDTVQNRAPRNSLIWG